ncbi:MAG: Dyp-type peroxidase [Myxococcales bacterium]|nr:Dyp-type peroxidase [Myxococcales bacterium]
MPEPDSQSPILSPRGRLARYHAFALDGDADDARDALAALDRALAEGDAVVGLGEPLCRALDVTIEGMRTFPALSGAGIAVPSTQGALMVALLGDDRGVLLHRSRALQAAIGDAFVLESLIDTFVHRDSRDLTGYVDGTENPEGEQARAAAIVAGAGAGLDGGSFVAVQRWVHDLDAFEDESTAERDRIIGRRLSDNEEMDDAPQSAHVKRSAQESFDPEAFMVRRSMPFVGEHEEGLLFVAYGESLDRYESVMRRMLGLDDGIVDALFRFSHPTDGGYYFCPPLRDGKLDLRAVGID